jgi:hypothetical protein
MAESKELFLGKIDVEYGQFYFDNLDEEKSLFDGDVEETFEGQSNGICGAAVKGMLYFIAGLNAGPISVCIELSEGTPEVARGYDDVVEVSFNNLIDSIALCQWGYEKTFSLDLPKGNYRVRYSVAALGKEHSDGDDWELPIPDQWHLIQLWPAEHSEDAIIEANSEAGKYWHSNFGNNR